MLEEPRWLAKCNEVFKAWRDQKQSLLNPKAWGYMRGVCFCVCACKDKSESHFTSPDICCRTRGRADVSRRVCWLKLLAFWRHVQALSVCPSDLISIWCMLLSHKPTTCILVFKHTEINVSAFRMCSWSASYNISATTCTMELKNNQNIKQIFAFGT